jgi:hypothetical protein
MKYLYYRALSLIVILVCYMTDRAQIPSYAVAERPWTPGLGSSRAVLTIGRPTAAVRIRITWRLHDLDPDQKRFLIISAQTGDTIENAYRIRVNNEQCDIAVGPLTKPGKYYFYYLPFKPDADPGSYRYGYLPVKAPDSIWVKRNHLNDAKSLSRLPVAIVSIMEARTAFDSFYPMEIVPTIREKKDFLSKHAENFLLFPESRRFPIRMRDEIPLKWIKETPGNVFRGIAQKNEYYVFQIGLYAVSTDLDSVQVIFSDLKSSRQTISAKSITCFNTEGINTYGHPFNKRLPVAKGRVQALWIGIDIPAHCKPDLYRATVRVSASGTKTRVIFLQIKVTNQYSADRGDGEPWRYSRLRWLNSPAGISDRPTAAFTPIKNEGGHHFSFSGKQVVLGRDGLPASITVFGTDLLSGPIQCFAGSEQFNLFEFQTAQPNGGSVAGTWSSRSEHFLLSGEGSLQFDGYFHYTIRLKALQNWTLNNFRLQIPFKKGIARYMMGMGLPGTTVPDSLDAKWKGPHDSFWIGNPYGGLYCELLGSSYHGPLLNLYNPSFPASWYNQDKGGFSIKKENDKVIAAVYTGSRNFQKGEEVAYEFDLIPTPIKKLDTKAQFTDRYYHNGSNPWPDSMDAAAGIKVINIHQGNAYNPYINYPFLTKNKIKYFADHWHKKGIKTKIYFTVRELTNHTQELWALRSLGQEIFSGGKGGGYPWLREHLTDNYQVAWYTPGDMGDDVDAAIETAPGDSRWYNFYIRGLIWLLENEDIDGIYLDDVAFDRHIIKRMREVMDSTKPGCLIDLHSNTGFSKGPAIQYTAFFPYIDKLWFGESFQYDKMPPANWLVETSGIPFGLMGDMLQGGGNPWRGMVYGMTVRYPWFTDGVNCDPRDVWKVWDKFGIADACMIGYWDEKKVINTSDSNVLATAYIKQNKLLIAVASWSPQITQFTLHIDWDKIGWTAQDSMAAPFIKNFQGGKIFSLHEPITVAPARGWLFVIERKKK